MISAILLSGTINYTDLRMFYPSIAEEYFYLQKPVFLRRPPYPFYPLTKQPGRACSRSGVHEFLRRKISSQMQTGYPDY
jgi:hypothetical protein